MSSPVDVGTDQDYSASVYPELDTENSRWFYFSSACRPFGMVNLSPDTELNGAWRSGYRYDTDTIKGFSHIHAWQLSGVSVMPVSTADDALTEGTTEDFYSSFSHDSEMIHPGYHRVELDRYDMQVELTSTTRVGFHRYRYTQEAQGIVFALSGPLGPSAITDGHLEQQDSHRLIGSVISTPTFRRPKPVKIHFAVELNRPIGDIVKGKNGNYLITFDKAISEATLMKVAISYTSAENAQYNLDHELPHWDFDQVIQESKEQWNELLGRIDIKGGNEQEQRRFYTDLWKALQGRRIISDANGAYPDNTGETFRIGQIPLDRDNQPMFNHYNSDSFWGAQWTLNTLWGLVYPDIMSDFVQSLLQYYRDGGLIPRGPSGGHYTYVMTGASSTPFIVSAYQKGIRDFDIDLAYEGLKKNHLPGGIMTRAGYEHGTELGGGLTYYLAEGWVPYPIPEGDFGSHQDGPSLTMEYAYQDWTLAQLAQVLGYHDDHEEFISRSANYKHVYDPISGWMRPKDQYGVWRTPFDPFAIEEGFNESNGAQSTWFVPHDLHGLATLMGGDSLAVAKLNHQFEQAEKLGFTSGTAHAKETHPEYSRIPINYGNQPSIQTAFIFAHLGRPDLTENWIQKIRKEVYGALSTDRGYNGDEDQGLMGSLAVLMKIGLFQMNGGTEADPNYQLYSPAFEEVKIKLHPDYHQGEYLHIKNDIDNGTEEYKPMMLWKNQIQDAYQLRHSQLVSGGIIRWTRP